MSPEEKSRFYAYVCLSTPDESFLNEIKKIVNPLDSHAFLALIELDFFDVIHQAASNGNLDILQYFQEKISNDNAFTKILRNHDFRGFRLASRNGHLNIVDYYLNLFQSDQKQLVAAFYFEPFREAVRNQHSKVVARLLQFPSVINYAQLRPEYQALIPPKLSSISLYQPAPLEETLSSPNLSNQAGQ